MKTCRPAIQTINALSAIEKLNILPSVLFTVLIFLFSLVRKYFWFRFMVESELETLYIDSSSAVVCSGEVPCLDGSAAARDSFSTYQGILELWWHHHGLRQIFGETLATQPTAIIEMSDWEPGLTAISKSTIFSTNVLISLLKQNLYSPCSLAVNTKSPCRSF